MMGVLEIDLQGAATQKNLERALRAVSSASLALFLESEAHKVIVNRLDDRFKKEGDDASGRWSALKQTTQEFRISQGFGAAHPINRRTGALYEWLMGERPRVNLSLAGANYQFPGHYAADRWTQVKFQTAQRGRSKPNTPARPVVAASMTDMALVQTRLATYLAFVMGGWR